MEQPITPPPMTTASAEPRLMRWMLLISVDGQRYRGRRTRKHHHLSPVTRGGHRGLWIASDSFGAFVARLIQVRSRPTRACFSRQDRLDYYMKYYTQCLPR